MGNHDNQEPRPDTWSVFATFRRSRLALARHITTLAGAMAFAERLRRERFHERDAVFVVHDQTGRHVDRDPATSAGDVEPPSRPEVARIPGTERAARALERAHVARVTLAATFERRMDELERLGNGGAHLREMRERQDQVDAGSRAALASMQAAVDALRDES